MMVWAVQGRYEGRWETVFSADRLEEARSILQDYRTNDLSTIYRITRTRE